ncbi:hypothetical protein CAPTEDRAFT_184136 [Capitella teleta]|uniref:Syndetin C-terminal domain-containing protein n=1 Tax=Capitella teleta TaxID=283909 RepID=R7UGJ7_CAPTE|nr:hypothetical protein CAPTEDRAFT_184136 [Capitella teleta]|eukprot:ELU05654.1 hypothetical protein CAPTEDRAFT_184136 [Capitella teleta]
MGQREIEERRQKLRDQLQAVSRKVSDLVLENHPAYAVELQRVMELQQTLQNANVICSNSRRKLNAATHQFTTSLGLLANYRKRQQLVALLKSLRTIKTLQRTDIRLREMLEEEDYPGAIQLCLECQKAASTFKHYHCIRRLSSKLQDTLVMIEESLDVALSKTCAKFDEHHYFKLQKAYKLLGKTQTAIDQLHMHFTSAIHSTAFNIVLGFVELSSSGGETSSQKRQYSDLCRNISGDLFTPCLIDLCKALWEVMKSYHCTMQWHEHQSVESETTEGEPISSSAMVETSLNRKYLQQKLQHGLTRIWGDVQQKVKIFVLSTDLSYFKYEEFIQVLDIVNRLIQVGEEFCDSQSEGLQDSLRKQSINYFRSYHRARMDELHMFLENEAWELCPVKASFSVLMLQEFKFLRQKSKKTELNNSQDKLSDVGYFDRYADGGSPFDIQTEEEETEDVMATNGVGTSASQETTSQDSDSDEDVPDELKQEFIDEKTGEDAPNKRPSSYRRRIDSKAAGKMAPIITNTTLNVCRLFGRYLQMMTVLKPIAFDVTICMSQLFDYYLFSIFTFFGSEAEAVSRSLSNKLRTTLKRIHDNLILDEDDDVHFSQPGGAGSDSGVVATMTDDSKRDKVPHPHLSSIVDLMDERTMYGLAQRIVATESLVFLAEQFEFLQPHLEANIPASKNPFLQQFYSQTVSTAQELRLPVYVSIASRSIDYDNLTQQMHQVKWDIHDIMSQHSAYVDKLVVEFEAFHQRLSQLSKKVPVPKAVNHVIWEHCIRLANHAFVNGYANAKKCTNEGRALMQLDFQQFLIKLEKLTDLRPIPYREFVDSYVKAYYFPEAQLETWIRDHKEYSGRQLSSLVTCIPQLNKKSRQRIIGMIEESEKNRR